MFLIMMSTNILQDKNIYFILIRVTLMFMQKALESHALQSKIDINVPISIFKKSSKNYLQDNSLVLKYTK